MRIDPASDMPIFQQIAAAIREAIAAGVFRPGDTIPSIRATALELLVNPNTVARAYAELERDGLIAPERGRGMVVARRTEDAARSRTIEAVESSFTSGIHMARRAGLDRRRVDAVYRQCWSHTPPGVAKPRPSAEENKP